MARPRIPDALKAEVRARAKSLCEYCHTDETWQYIPFTIDHIVPIRLAGPTTEDNLALACLHCNRQKSDDMQAVDPVTQQRVPLFNPRTQAWQEHFIWSRGGLDIIALTITGGATLHALDLNRERVRRIREADAAVGRHPPQDDPVRTDKG